MSKNNQPKVRVRIVKEKAKKHPVLATIGVVSFAAIASTGIAMAIPQSRDAIGDWVAQRFSPEYKDVTDTKDNLTISNGLYAKQVESLNSDIESTNTELDTIKAEKTALQNQLTTAQTRITTLEGNITTLTSQKTSLEGQLEQANTDKQSLQAQLEQANTDKQTLQTQLDGKIAEIESLNEQINEKTTEIANLNTQISAKTSEIQSITAQLSTVQAENEQLKAFKYGKYVSIYNGFELYISILDNGTAKLHTDDENYILGEYTRDGNDITINYEEDGTPAELNLTITSPTSLYGNEEMNFVLLTDELQTVIQEKNTAQAQLEQANTDKQSLQAQLGQANTDKQTLQTQLDEKVAEIESLETTNSNLQSQITTLEGNITTLTSQKTSLEEQLQTANTNISSLNAQISEKEQSISSLENRIATLEASLAMYTQYSINFNFSDTSCIREMCLVDDVLNMNMPFTYYGPAQFYPAQKLRIVLYGNGTLIFSNNENITITDEGNNSYLIQGAPGGSVDVDLQAVYNTGTYRAITDLGGGNFGSFYGTLWDGNINFDIDRSYGYDIDPNLTLENVTKIIIQQGTSLVNLAQFGNIPIYYNDSFTTNDIYWDQTGIPEHTPIVITEENDETQKMLIVRDGDYLIKVLNYENTTNCIVKLCYPTMFDQQYVDDNALINTSNDKYMGLYVTYNNGDFSRQIDIESDYTITIGEEINNNQPETPEVQTTGTVTISWVDNEQNYTQDVTLYDGLVQNIENYPNISHVTLSNDVTAISIAQFPADCTFSYQGTSLELMNMRYLLNDNTVYEITTSDGTGTALQNDEHILFIINYNDSSSSPLCRLMSRDGTTLLEGVITSYTDLSNFVVQTENDGAYTVSAVETDGAYTITYTTYQTPEQTQENTVEVYVNDTMTESCLINDGNVELPTFEDDSNVRLNINGAISTLDLTNSTVNYTIQGNADIYLLMYAGTKADWNSKVTFTPTTQHTTCVKCDDGDADDNYDYLYIPATNEKTIILSFSTEADGTQGEFNVLQDSNLHGTYEIIFGDTENDDVTINLTYTDGTSATITTDSEMRIVKNYVETFTGGEISNNPLA